LTLEKSGTENNYPSHLRVYRWSSSNQQPNSTTKTFWELRSSVRLATFLNSKKLELFLKGLPNFELRGLIDAPGFFKDHLFLELLQALASLQNCSENSIDPKEDLLQRLHPVQSLLGMSIWSENLLNTYKGVLRYELSEIRQPIRKVKKFSGWVRNSSAVGSKRRTGSLDLDPEITKDIFVVEKIDFFHYFMTPNPDFDDLGISAGTYLYPLLKRHFEMRKELPEQLKILLF